MKNTVYHDIEVNGELNIAGGGSLGKNMLALISGAIFEKGDILVTTSTKSPAERFGGTWEQIAQGRTLIGANGSYSLGSTGGSNTHIHSLGTQDDTDAVALIEINTYPAVFWKRKIYPTGYNPDFTGQLVNNFSNDGAMRQQVTPVVGSTKSTEAMPPYLAVNYWQKIA